MNMIKTGSLIGIFMLTLLSCSSVVCAGQIESEDIEHSDTDIQWTTVTETVFDLPDNYLDVLWGDVVNSEIVSFSDDEGIMPYSSSFNIDGNYTGYSYNFISNGATQSPYLVFSGSSPYQEFDVDIPITFPELGRYSGYYVAAIIQNLSYTYTYGSESVPGSDPGITRFNVVLSDPCFVVGEQEIPLIFGGNSTGTYRFLALDSPFYTGYWNSPRASVRFHVTINMLKTVPSLYNVSSSGSTSTVTQQDYYVYLNEFRIFLNIPDSYSVVQTFDVSQHNLVYDKHLYSAVTALQSQMHSDFTTLRNNVNSNGTIIRDSINGMSVSLQGKLDTTNSGIATGNQLQTQNNTLVTQQTSDMNKGMDNLANGYDNTSANTVNSQLSSAIADYDQHEDLIMSDASAKFDAFSFSDILTFTGGLASGLSLVSSFATSFFVASGEFTNVVYVGFALMFLSIVIGIWRFARG